MHQDQCGSRPRALADLIDPATSALVVIDVQNDFCHEDGVFGRLGASLERMPEMLQAVQNLIEEARRLQIMIIWVRATYDPVVRSAPFEDALSKPGLTPDVCLEGSWGAQWAGGLQPDPQADNEITLTKHRFSAFWDTPIDLYLRSNSIESVILTGVVTEGCVESTARDAFFRNYFVVMPRDSVTSYSHERHEASLRKMAHTMGTVPASEEVLAIWRTRHVGPRNWQLAVKQAAAPVGLGNLIAPRRSALLIVDMQNDFCHAEGVMAKRRGADISTNQSIIGPIARMLNAARTAGIMVIHIRAVYGPQSASPTWIGGDTEASIALELCLPGSWGAEIVDELAPVASEPVVVKHRYSAFLDTSLETLLRSNRIGTVVVVGTATMACVESTVRDAMMRDYRVVVPRGCVASRGHMKHLDDASMETMGLFFADVVDDDDVLGFWTELQSSASEKQAVS